MTEQTPRGRILVADDEEAIRLFVARTLRRAGFDVESVEDGAQARTRLLDEPFDLLVSDVKMPGLDGISLLTWSRERQPRMPVVLMTGHGSIPDAVAALKAGAFDYVTKPFERADLLRAVEAALETGRLAAENRMLRRLLEEGRRFEGLIGSTPPMRELYRLIDAVADREGVVLLRGESGTGKELVARAIHDRGPRRDRDFVAFHCAAVPATLLAGELFGVQKGAYTGATRDREGMVGRAEGGTLFLDEIGDVPMDVQPALLRLLESGEATPIGSEVTRRVDVRVIAATHRDLAELVEAGAFRRDLYYRLNVFPITAPPLRQRRGDVPDLVDHFLAMHGRDPDALSMEARAVLQAQDWPGNVRQLENAIERMVAIGAGRKLGVEDIPEDCVDARESARGEPAPFKAAVAEFEERYLDRLLRACGGNVSEAARRAGISRPTLHAKIQQHRLDPDRYR